EVRARERLEQELRLAHLIQQQFLPRKVPDLPGWQVAAFYRPARQVGGDFYDFIDLVDGQLGLVVGDVTGHGVPAALVMATTRSAIRSEAPRLVAPGHAMFGFPRLRDEMGRHQGGQPLIDGLLEALDRFTGPGWAQEDDITLVTLTRSARSEPREIASFAVPSRAGNERVVMDRVAEAITAAGIDMPGLARIKTAVSEAAMNAI